jgi:preprotein translocase SecE subunit
VARNRQRAKERQARRKAEREGGDGAQRPQPAAAQPEPEPEPEAPELSASEELRVGVPPEDLGTSESVLEYEQDLDEQEGEEHYDPEEDHPEEDGPIAAGPRGVRGSDDEAEHKDRGRLIQFLHAVVAELRRVQWPDRQTLTTLTGVVLGFVLLAGGYLGLLDAIFSRVIQAIL